MVRYDILLRQGVLVGENEEQVADIAISDGIVAAIGEDLAGEARSEIALEQSPVLPGVIDANVHFTEPGRTDWGGWATGSAALVAGGATACIEMPPTLHSPAPDLAGFEATRRVAEERSWVDFALWGGLTPRNLAQLHDLAGAGAIGFRALMSSTGEPGTLQVDDFTLYEGMRVAAGLGLPVAVHAENEAITSGLAAAAIRLGRTTVRDYLESRPVVAEIEAIGRALAMAEATGCGLHITHVSTGRGVALVTAARARGVDVSCETCPHYLVFTDDDLEHMGAIAKSAPPLRSFMSQQELWKELLAGEVDFVASDHTPVPPAMRLGDDFFAIQGGVSGCQHLLAALISAGEGRGLTLPAVARLTAGAVARRFRLAGKGAIVVGADADLTWIRRIDPAPIPPWRIRYRHPRSIWDEVPVAIEPVGTIVRGSIVYREGELIGRPFGRLLTPEPREQRSWPFDDRD